MFESYHPEWIFFSFFFPKMLFFEVFLHNLFFDVLNSAVLFLGFFFLFNLIFSSHSVLTVLYLVGVFLSTSLLFALSGFLFFSFMYVVVYVGAIAILFLFVIMVLDLNNLVKYEISLLKALMLVFLSLFVTEVSINLLNVDFLFLTEIYRPGLFHVDIKSVDLFTFWQLVEYSSTAHHMTSLGVFLYTLGLWYVFGAGLLLFIVMMGVIIIVLQNNYNYEVTHENSNKFLTAFYQQITLFSQKDGF